MSERSDLRNWSFLALLLGGVLILAGAFMGSFMMGTWAGMGMGMGGMMNAYAPADWGPMMAWWMGLLGLVTGGFVLLAAYYVYRAREVAVWSVVAIVAGALSLFAMGGWILGAVLAIVGGALALVGKQQDAPRPGGA